MRPLAALGVLNHEEKEVHEELPLCANGLACSWVRTQLGHALHASRFLTVFASSGSAFQTNNEFERIPFLAHRWVLALPLGLPSVLFTTVWAS